MTSMFPTALVTLLAILSCSGNTILWEELFHFEGHQGKVTCVRFLDKSGVFCSSSYDGSLRFWDSKTGTAIATLLCHAQPIRTFVFSSSGKYAVTCSEDETAKIWNVDTRTQSFTPLAHNGA